MTRGPWIPLTLAAMGLAAVIFLDTKLRTKGKWAWPEEPRPDFVGGVTVTCPDGKIHYLSPGNGPMPLPCELPKEVPPDPGPRAASATKPLLGGTGRGSHDHVNATTEPACWALVIFSPKDLDAFPDDVLSCAETCMEAGRCQG